MKPPLSARALVDLDFLETRHRLLDVAAFLDRIDRASARPAEDRASDAPATPDHRLDALRRALERLAEDRPGRAADIQRVFSDPTDAPLDSAAGMKGATGAWPGPPAAVPSETPTSLER